jgi:hypothetical protein
LNVLQAVPRPDRWDLFAVLTLIAILFGAMGFGYLVRVLSPS